MNLTDCEIGKTSFKNNQNDAMKQQKEFMDTMQKAKLNYDLNIEDPEEDEMEKLFLENMDHELEANAEYEQTDQYTSALTKLEEIKQTHNQDNNYIPCKPSINEEFGQLEDDLEEQIMNDSHQMMEEEKLEESDFKSKYNKLIQDFSNAIQNRKNFPLIQVSEITDRVWEMIDDWRNFESVKTEGCYKETLIKGILVLIDNKNTKAVFRLCKCCIHIINSIFNDKLRLSEEERFEDTEFVKIFGSLKSTVQILFKYSKDDKNDDLYESEKVYDSLLNVLLNYYIEGRLMLDQLTTKILKKSNGPNVEIKNTSATFDMLIYIVGLLKNSSMNKTNQNILHNKNAIQVLSKL